MESPRLWCLLTALQVVVSQIHTLDETLVLHAKDPKDSALVSRVDSAHLDDEVISFQVHGSDDLRREGYDLHEVLLPQLERHSPENTSAPRVLLVVEDHDRIVVKSHVGPIL